MTQTQEPNVIARANGVRIPEGSLGLVLEHAYFGSEVLVLVKWWTHEGVRTRVMRPDEFDRISEG